MKTIIKIVSIVTLFFANYCNAQSCEKIKEKFDNHKVAVRLIKTTRFNFTEDCDTSKSSWIKSLKFKSCDLKVGYIFLETKKKTYIYSNIPISLWNEFKYAKSLGKFYNTRIKGKYKIQIKNK
ncbi:MAG: KTSC domain-containing protein [Tenacibaculum sp.]|nr:KTSC domain-containing protein [Tenacibaculum sp.]